VGVPITAHGSDFLQAVIGKLKTLPPDQTNRIVAAGNRPFHRKATADGSTQPTMLPLKPGELP